MQASVAVFLIWQLVIRCCGIPAENYYNAGLRLYAQAHYAAAEIFFCKATSKAILAGWAWHNAGNAAYQQQHYTDAVACYQKALEHNPEDEDTWFNLELARKQLLQQPAAVLVINKTVNRPPPPKPTGVNFKPKLSGARPEPGPDPNAEPNDPNQPLTSAMADALIAEYQAKEQLQLPEQARSAMPAVDYGQPGDVFSQSPEEIVATMREETRASYPFRPGTSLLKPKAFSERINW